MGHDNHRKMGHVQDFKVYVYVLLGLFALTVLTVWVSYFDFGPFNDVVAIAIASGKASLVVLFFMHGRYEGKLIWAFIYYPLVILATLLAALFLDYGNRPDSIRAVQAPSVITDHHGDHGETTHGEESHGESDHTAPASQGDDHSPTTDTPSGDGTHPAPSDAEPASQEEAGEKPTADDKGGH